MNASLDVIVRLVSVLLLLTLLILLIVRYPRKGRGPMLSWSRPPSDAEFNPPPGWPPTPPGWVPPPGWQPDPSWPPAPPDWQWWIPR